MPKLKFEITSRSRGSSPVRTRPSTGRSARAATGSMSGSTGIFEELDGEPASLELTRVVESPAVTHLTYRVVR